MEIQPLSAGDRVDAVRAALGEIAAVQALEAAVDTLQALMPSVQTAPTLGAGSAVEHGAARATAEGDAVHPDARLDRGAEVAVAQTFSRPATVPASALPLAEASLAATAQASTGFALPADQLVNVAVIGLTIGQPDGWPMQRRAMPAEAPPSRPSTPVAEREDAAPEHAEPEPESDPEAPTEQQPGPVAETDAEADWAEPLSRALREALRAKAVPRALQAALEQWQLGRRVLLACPRGGDAGGAAWAFVLWPRAGSRKGLPLALTGVRLDARIAWTRVPPNLVWCHARVMKEQHPRQGRQLVALDAKGTAAVDCEVQLGPVPLRTPRWREACVRIDAVRRLWAALGDQWSVTVVVASRSIG